MPYSGDLPCTSSSATSDETIEHLPKSTHHCRAEQSSALRPSSVPSSFPYGHTSKHTNMARTRSRSRHASASATAPTPRITLKISSDTSSGEQELARRLKVVPLVRRLEDLIPAADHQPLTKTRNDQERHAGKAGENASAYTVRSRRHVIENREDVDDLSGDYATNELVSKQFEPDNIELTDEDPAVGVLRESTRSNATLEQKPGVAQSRRKVSQSRKFAPSGKQCRPNRTTHGRLQPHRSLLDCILDLQWYIKVVVAVVFVALTIVGILELTGQPDIRSGTTNNTAKSTPAVAIGELQHAINETCGAATPVLSPSSWDDVARSPAELLQPVLELLIPQTALERITFADLCRNLTVRTSLRTPSATTALHVIPALDRAAIVLRLNAARLQLAATDMQPTRRPESASGRVWESPSTAMRKRAEALGKLADALETLRKVVVHTSMP